MTAARVWLITGIARGLGRALAEAVLARGETVVGTTRGNPVDLEIRSGTLHVLSFDLADERAAEATVAQAFALVGRVDVVVNNAGYTLIGALEDAGDDEVARLFAVNVFGPFRVIRAALPRLRAQGYGHIVNISSVQGEDPGAAVGIYAASKAALDAMTKALAIEVAPLGLRVTAVVPGGLRTEFLSERSVDRSQSATAAAYAASVGAAIDRFREVHGRQPGDPTLAAEAIISAVSAADPPRRLLLGSDALSRSRRAAGAAAHEQNRWEAVSRSIDLRDAQQA